VALGETFDIRPRPPGRRRGNRAGSRRRDGMCL